ncbi:MAG: NUDIX domain-containing protein [Panacagrimonas sp.]
MTASRYRFCPQCGLPLESREEGGVVRPACADRQCGFVHWDNPVPVVAAIVEHEGRIVLARNVAWPPAWYALVTGFLERGEDPQSGIIREVKEELNLDAEVANYVGIYEFRRMNQIIIAYHVPATGTIRLNEELADYRHEAFDQVRYWEAGTGYALRDWLRGKGYDPQVVDWARGAG